MPALPFWDARSVVIREVSAAHVPPPVETVPLEQAYGRILAQDARADRDYPPFRRAMRDGFAVQHGDLPGTFRLVGEVRAGEEYRGTVGSGDAVEIMTGAPVPEGADAVVMIEHCTRDGNGTVSSKQSLPAMANISAAGCEVRSGDAPVNPGIRINHTVTGWLASIGMAKVQVYRRMRVAIVATGDELVEISEQPLSHQIRNSNTYSLAAQVQSAGAVPVRLPIARDNAAHTREQIARALECDLVLLSGGVSAGRYDVVEPVLAELGAVFYFDRVQIQPGAPVVFGKLGSRFFFGLPGNPGSTVATFALFARAAIELLSGMNRSELPIALARLTIPLAHKGGLTRFLPAVVDRGEVTPIPSAGSADLPSLARANAYLIADPEQKAYAAGDTIQVIFL